MFVDTVVSFRCALRMGDWLTESENTVLSRYAAAHKLKSSSSDGCPREQKYSQPIENTLFQRMNELSTTVICLNFHGSVMSSSRCLSNSEFHNVGSER